MGGSDDELAHVEGSLLPAPASQDFAQNLNSTATLNLHRDKCACIDDHQEGNCPHVQPWSGPHLIFKVMLQQKHLFRYSPTPAMPQGWAFPDPKFQVVVNLCSVALSLFDVHEEQGL